MPCANAGEAAVPTRAGGPLLCAGDAALLGRPALSRAQTQASGEALVASTGIASRPSAQDPVVRETVLDVRLPKTTRLDRIEVRRIRILPGHAAGLHVQNGPVVGSIVEGSVVYQVEGEQRSVLGPGEVFHAPEGARIARFDAGDEGITFLAYFLLSAGQEPTIEFPDD